jgi:hypothetical protein
MTAVYGCESWTLKKHGKAKNTAAGKKILRKTARYTVYGRKRKQDIIKELKTHQVLVKKINYCKNTWIQRVCKMDRCRLTNAVYNETPISQKEEPSTLVWIVILRPEPATRPKSEVHESIMVMDLTLIS